MTMPRTMATSSPSRGPWTSMKAGGEAGARPHVGSPPALGRDVRRQLGGQHHVQGAVVRRVQVRELRELGDQESVLVSGALPQDETAGAGHRDVGGAHVHTGQLPDVLEQPLLEVSGRVLGPLLLRDRPAHLGPCATSRGELAGRKRGPRGLGRRSRRGCGVAADEAHAVCDPVAQLADRVRRQLVTAGLALRDRRGTGLGQHVVPGPVEELARDDVVAVALGNEQRQVGQPAGVGQETCVERQGAVEDRGAGVARGVVQHQAAGEGGPSTEADQQHWAAHWGDVVQPAAEPVHGVPERLGDRAADAAVGEPCEPAALDDRRPHRCVRRTGRQVRGEADDVALVRAATVQEHHERCNRVLGAVRRDDRRREGRAGHHVSTGTSSAAVRTPLHRRTSPGRSRRSTGAALAKSPQLALGSIHITSNSLPSGSLA